MNNNKTGSLVTRSYTYVLPKFEDPKWTLLKLLRNMFEIIVYTDLWVIETFRLRRGRLWERDILNTKQCARVKQRLAGKRDDRRHSTTHCSEMCWWWNNLWYGTSFITLISGEGLTSFAKLTIITFLGQTASVSNLVLASNQKVPSFF